MPPRHFFHHLLSRITQLKINLADSGLQPLILTPTLLGDGFTETISNESPAISSSHLRWSYHPTSWSNQDTGNLIDSGPPRLKTNSEVATMTYRKSVITRTKKSQIHLVKSKPKPPPLPIPKIINWNDGSLNPIGAGYIIREGVLVVQIHQAWPKMNSEQHMLCTKTLVLPMKK
ncbi:hypothetical protein F1880_006571 [Penicillium rolfsii]|nr:hypothetical protein F1880_006571 [Penicillium rolfsii]